MKNPHAVALGKLGGAKGGRARAAVLSARRREEIARVAGTARWRSVPSEGRAAIARNAALVRWGRAVERLTAADAPVAVRRLLKSYDPTALRWADLDDRHVIVREIVLRGDAVANRWLRRKLSRAEVRLLIRAYAGAGCNEPERAILRKKLNLTVKDLPLKPYVGLKRRTGKFSRDSYFDPRQRAAAKQKQRDEDAQRLRAGEISAEDLRSENSFLPLGSGFSIVRSGGAPSKRRS
jgi:hypothetical protein